MVTITSFAVVKCLPPGATTTRTGEDSPIFTRRCTNGSAPCETSNVPVYGNGFLSMNTELLVVPGAGHGLSYMVDREAYLAALESFLRSVLD